MDEPGVEHPGRAPRQRGERRERRPRGDVSVRPGGHARGEPARVSGASSTVSIDPFLSRSGSGYVAEELKDVLGDFVPEHALHRCDRRRRRGDDDGEAVARVRAKGEAG